MRLRFSFSKLERRRLSSLMSAVSGELYAWGRGEDGQLGVGDTKDQYQPLLVESLKDVGVIQVACGSGHTVILTNEGEVLTWGRGDDGRLGHGDNGWKYVPRLIESLSGIIIVQVTCGSYHTAAVSSQGELYTWGGGMYGKLGHGNENGYATPCKVEALKMQKVRQVACGSRHTVVLSSNLDGIVYTWGDKENGVSGHGETEGHQYLPLIVQALKSIKIAQISACGFHTAALTDKGDVYTWGEGKFGRLGHNSERNYSIPHLIKFLVGKKIIQVACGGFHTAAITDLGVLYSWGGGEHGQLGLGDKINRTRPCLVVSLHDQMITQVTCGWSHTIALTANKTVYTWGNGDHGKLGHKNTSKVSLPQLVESLQGKKVIRLASYNEHTVALTERTPYMRPGPLSSFVRDLRSLLENNEFSDVTFLVDGHKVYAHKALLAARSDHFRAMFKSGMRESQSSEILLPNIRHCVFIALLEYLYIDTVEIPVEISVELYSLADLYTLDRLKILCENIVSRDITVENAASLLLISDEYHVSHLKKICMKYIISHFDIVTKSEGFRNLTRELILETLEKRE